MTVVCTTDRRLVGGIVQCFTSAIQLDSENSAGLSSFYLLFHKLVARTVSFHQGVDLYDIMNAQFKLRKRQGIQDMRCSHLNFAFCIQCVLTHVSRLIKKVEMPSVAEEKYSTQFGSVS